MIQVACNHNQYKVENSDKTTTRPLLAQAVLLRYGDDTESSNVYKATHNHYYLIFI